MAPENTLAAFRKGAEYGYRMFECDAKLSEDDVVFLMHDATLNRTTNGHGVGGEQSWLQLSQLDAGSWHSRHFSGEPLPTLANLANYCIRNRYFLNIEIKPTPGVEFKTGEVVAQQAALLWQHEEVPPLLTSFQVESLKGAQQVAPQLPRGLLLHNLPDAWQFLAKHQAGCAATNLWAIAVRLAEPLLKIPPEKSLKVVALLRAAKEEPLVEPRPHLFLIQHQVSV